ncbi:unnamed protein product [Parajaminaea phylloscopi]
MVSPDEAFTQAYRSHRIELGDDPASLPGVTNRRNESKQRKQPSAVVPGGGIGIGGDDDDDAEAGGFIADDDGGDGGFIADDDQAEDDEGAGGFVVGEDGDSQAEEDAQASKGPQLPAHLPLTEVPHALSILSLPADDETTLAVFRAAAIPDPASASSSGARRRGQAANAIKVIARDEFRQVCEILLDDQPGTEAEGASSSANHSRPSRPSKRRRRPSQSQSPAAEEEETAAAVRPRTSRLAAARQRRAAQEQLAQVDSDAPSDHDDGEDEYVDSDDDQGRAGPRRADSDSDEGPSGFSDAKRGGAGKAKGARSRPSRSRRSTDGDDDDLDDLDDSRRRRRRRPGKARKSSPASGNDDDDDDDEPAASTALSEGQREAVQHGWQLFADKLEEIYPEWDGSRIGKREIQRLAISVGEKISDKEVEEMLQLGYSCFAPASSKYATRQSAQSARLRSAQAGGSDGVGLDEFAGILVTGRMV